MCVCECICVLNFFLRYFFLISWLFSASFENQMVNLDTFTVKVMKITIVHSIIGSIVEERPSYYESEQTY